MGAKEFRESVNGGRGVVKYTSWDVPLLAFFGGGDMDRVATETLDAVQNELRCREYDREDIHIRFVNDEDFIPWSRSLDEEAASVRRSYYYRRHLVDQTRRFGRTTEGISAAEFAMGSTQGVLASHLESIDDQVARAQEEQRVLSENTTQGRRRRRQPEQEPEERNVVRRTIESFLHDVFLVCFLEGGKWKPKMLVE